MGFIPMNNPTGTVNYSTQEQDTGITWIDGKKIYQKTFDCGAMPHAGSKTVAIANSEGDSDNYILIDKVINYDTILMRDSGLGMADNFLKTYYVGASAGSYMNIYIVNANRKYQFNISMYAATNRTDFKAYVTVWYTKHEE